MSVTDTDTTAMLFPDSAKDTAVKERRRIMNKTFFIPANIGEFFVFLKIILMKRLILIILAAVLTAGAWSQDSLSISLLTCSQGRDVSSAFGHSALRVKDYAHGRDLVFNYGTFSFNEPNFFLKFLKGDLNYFLSVNSFDAFKRSYDAVGRGIIEQPLSLTPAQAAGIYAFLIDNYKPANRYYLYDFLQDNCATRIRDVFDRDGFSITDTLTGYTYRDELTRLVGDRRWMMFGIDLILGAGTDREITVRESAFLPDRLSEVLAAYSNEEMAGAPLAPARHTVSKPEPGPGKAMEVLSKATSPFTVFTLLFVLYLVFYLRSGNKWRFMSICSTITYIILGLGGVIICLMWFATNHVWTADNWNLLWMNPLFLIPVFMPNCWAKNLIIDLLAAVAAIGLICSWLLPQTFHPACAVIILLVVLLALSRRAIYRKY